MTRKCCLLLALALASPGCIAPMAHLDDETHKTPPPEQMVMPATPPIVTPDEVNEANAVEKARALAQELDYAANEHPATPSMTPAKETTKP